MSKPIIAITAGRQNFQTPRREPQMVWAGCSVDYINEVARSGGAPILLPFAADKEAVRAILQAAHGLLLTGGGDLISLAYGEEPHPKNLYQDPQRDEMELEAVRIALELQLPILGICRGPQTLNVALGGTLVQDIPSQVDRAVKHYSHSLAPALTHTVEIEPDSLLARIMGTTSLAVNSYHHQAVKQLGTGLRVNCRAKDGVIEGIESADDKPILAVQCHPEEIASAYPEFRKLFDWLVGEASER